jgi:hypothetical protein
MVLLVPIVPMMGIALFVWVLADPWWHPLLVFIGACLTIAGGIYAVWQVIRNERAVRLTSRPLENYRWLPQWEASLYLSHLELFLRTRGWRIILASAGSPDRVLVVADKTKSKHRVALMGVRPGQTAAPADVDSLDATRKEQLATRAALVVETKPTPEDSSAALDRGIMTLLFADLYTLEDALRVTD